MADKRDDEEFEDVDWGDSADDEVLFEEDDDDSMDDIRLGGDEDESEAEGDSEEVVELDENEEAAELDSDEDVEELEAPEPAEAAPAALAREELSSLNLQELPIALSIEVGRLQISAQQLMDLQKGNVLDLRVQPQAGVDLVVNNQLVGRAELVQVGDSLGIRVLEVGK